MVVRDVFSNLLRPLSSHRLVTAAAVTALVFTSALSVAVAAEGRHSGSVSWCSVTLEASKTSRNITLGTHRAAVAVYPLLVKVTRPRGDVRKDDVNLTLGALPDGVTGRAILDHASHKSTSPEEAQGRAETRSGRVELRVRPGTAPATYSTSVVARCGDSRFVVDLHLVVLAMAPRDALQVLPAEVTLSPGRSQAFCVSEVVRDGPRHRKRPSVSAGRLAVSGLPAHTTFSVKPADRHAPQCLRLLVRTTTATPTGNYPVTVSDRRGSGHFTLHVVASDSTDFTISGDPDGELTPGASLPLDLHFTNPGGNRLQLTSLTVALGALDAAHAEGCPVADNYTVTQFSGDVRTITIPAYGSSSLSTLGIAPETFPHVSMRETDADQTACLGSTLALVYTGTAQAL
jgi:hypothetical protein